MAYSHDKTLLASLGFADPDKKDKRHDLACRYLTEPGVLEKGFRTLGIEDKIHSFELEKVITKGSDQYKVIVGYVDVTVWLENGPTYIVEVKINQLPLGDVLRQITLYQEYRAPRSVLLVTAYTLTSSEVAALRDKGILHLKLGASFERYCAQQEASLTSSENEEV